MTKRYLKLKNNCIICNNKLNSKNILTRDKTKKKLFYCTKCDLSFFKYNPIKHLSKKNLDESRLKYDGLKLEKRKIDFKNGVNQSKKYFSEYLKNENKKNKILEIGSSWGYFLYLCKKKNFNVTGIEINKEKRDFIKRKLNISCFENIELIKNQKFDYIFLFYVIEYIPNIKEFFSKIYNMLEKNGQIILITPNLNDPIKTIWKNKNYLNFFYEKNAINYFSIKSLKKLFTLLQIKNVKIFCKQEYSFFNSIDWFLHNRPHPSKIVGGDLITENLIKEINLKFSKYKKFKKIFTGKIRGIDKLFKTFCKKTDFGNQILAIIKKK